MNTPEHQINPPEPGPCFKCEGESWITCPVCLGRGQLTSRWDTLYDCPECLGEREIECPYCR